MRFLIPFLCLMLLVACHNKSNLKRIVELEKENGELKRIHDILSIKISRLEDSILYGGFSLSLPNVLFENNKIISINQKLPSAIDSLFSTEIKYIIDKTNNPYLSNSITNVFYSDVYLNNEIDYNCKNKLNSKSDRLIIKLKPKGIGWNYYNVKSTLKNDRTGNIINITFTDSFYVYK